MIESARRQAVDVLLDQRLFTLDSDRYDAFMQALDNPPAPGTQTALVAASSSGMAEVEDGSERLGLSLSAPGSPYRRA